MRGERHAAVSEMLLETAEALAQNPRTALAAGELVWGAVFHACCAAERPPIVSHRHPRTRRELKETINLLAVDRNTRRNFVDAVDHPVRRLHDNFYSGQLSNADLTDDIQVGTSFVRELLQIAHRT
jgi:hypothetical protein